MDGSQERRGILRISGSDTAPPLKVKEGIFNEMSQLVEIFVVGSLGRRVVGLLSSSIPFLGGDDNLHTLLLDLSHDGVSVVSFVCKENVPRLCL